MILLLLYKSIILFIDSTILELHNFIISHNTNLYLINYNHIIIITIHPHLHILQNTFSDFLKKSSQFCSIKFH